MIRGERLNKPGNSWHSPKCLEGQPHTPIMEVERRYGSETAGDKVRRREGNSPDRQLRSLNAAECEMRCYCEDSQEVGLEAAIP